MTDPTATTSLTDASERLGVHYMTAYRYVRTGALDAERRGGRWYVSDAELEAFEHRRSHPNPRVRPSDGLEPTPIDRSAARRRALALADRLLRGDQGGSWRLVQDAVNSGADLSQVNASLLTPALRHIGERWEAGEASVGAEHRATVVAMRLIDRVGRQFTRPGRRRGAVVVCAAPGDRHGLPSAIVADLLRAQGLEAVDLGADTPGEEIVRIAVGQDQLIAVGICATTPVDAAAERRLGAVVRTVGDATGRPVLLGGSGIADEAMAERLAADHWSLDADDAVAWFVELSRYRTPDTEERPS